MTPALRRLLTAVCGALMGINVSAAAQKASPVKVLLEQFASPPDDAKVMMRWWWFGPAVTQQELDRELRVMKDVGIGGVEIQPVYPLALNDAAQGVQNQPYLSPEFLSSLRFAAQTASSLGMRVDITLGSGWPYGGPHTKIEEAAGTLHVERVAVPDGASSIPVPAVGQGEQIIAAFLGYKAITTFPHGRLEIPPGLAGADLLTFFISSRTGQQVKRASVGAEGFVLDHYDRAAINTHLHSVADVLLQAFSGKPPYAVFSDSLEVYGSDWTPHLLEEFRKRRGYDLLPYLPVLVSETSPQMPAVRHDWAKTLTDLAEDNYLKPIAEWAHAHGTQFRSQTYGQPPVVLSSNAIVDLAEGEHGPLWRRFSAARWAASANHLYGRNITSTETWTWLHSPSFRATPLDLKAEADRHFVEGVNQLIGHGWPYSPLTAPEPGWRFYAAAALNDHNPWFVVMPDLARYLQRVSYVLRQGRPVNDVALYVPTDDAWAHLPLGNPAMDEQVDRLLGPILIPEILNAGYGFDFIDDRALAKTGIPYKVLILPHVERMPLATLQTLQQFTAKGGRVIALRTLPSLAPGLLEGQRDTPIIQDLARRMFAAGSPRTRLVTDETALAKTLTEFVPPDCFTGSAAPSLGFVHRKTAASDVYFLANLSNRSLDTTASVAASGTAVEWWNPFSGEAQPADSRRVGDRTTVALHLEPYESRVLALSTSGTSKPSVPTAPTDAAPIDLSTGWTVTFTGTNRTAHMDHLRSWSDSADTRFYSGLATYEKSITLPPGARSSVWLDFGPGTPVEPDNNPNGMRALLESPVREAAVVLVNGKRAGYVWHPPYEVELTSLLHAGPNELRIVVANTAMNEMAETALPDDRLLNLRYGERFVAQDVSQIRPLPSGIVGPIRLVFR